MKLTSLTLLLLSSLINTSLATPTVTLSVRDAIAVVEQQHEPTFAELAKRRGGGRGSGGGTSGGGGTGGGRTGNGGGSVPGGSGVRPSYGSRYAGGATVPYAAGIRSPAGILPGLLVGSALGFWLFYSWGPYGAYRYELPAEITFYNQTSGMNETLPGICLCTRFLTCSCDAATGDGEYVDALLGDGSPITLRDRADVVQIVDENGTRTLAINGTLANGTAADSPAGLGQRDILTSAGWLGVAGLVSCVVAFL